jgi:hypothetical protein
MNVDEIIKFIQTVGFPIAVAIYVLVRMERTQRDLIKAVNNLAATLALKGIKIIAAVTGDEKGV